MSNLIPTSFFLDQFAQSQRGAIGTQFFGAAREGASTVEDLIAAVKAGAHLRLVTSKGEGWTAQRKLIDLLDTAEARVYAQEVLEREALPPEEKLRLKEERQERYRREYLRAQAPTERQLRFLKSLGGNERPANMLEASDLIEQRREALA